MLFGRDEPRSLVVSSFLGDNSPKGAHWLDRFDLSFHPKGKRDEKYSKYVVVFSSGNWELKTYSKAPPGGPRKLIPVSYGRGDGSSFEKAIVISASSENSGVDAEYTYLKRHFPGYHFRSQSLQGHNHKEYDVLEFTAADGNKKVIYFDVTSFLGKS